MKRFPIYLMLILGVCLGACHSDDNTTYEEAYADWKKENEVWIAAQQARTNPDGSPYFQTIVPEWNPGTFVLIHYFNDRTLTQGNLSPMLTSTVDTRYKVHFCNDVPMDSSTNQTTYGPGIFRTQLSQVIEGWVIALETMHCGDTAEIVIPYQSAYGATLTNGVPPFSNLRFNVRLVDIPYYEVSGK